MPKEKTFDKMTNNEVLLSALDKAVRNGTITKKEIKSYDKQLNRMFPNKYDLSSLYKDETEDEDNDEEEDKD